MEWKWSALALLHVHAEKDPDLEAILEKFIALWPRHNLTYELSKFIIMFDIDLFLFDVLLLSS